MKQLNNMQCFLYRALYILLRFYISKCSEYNLVYSCWIILCWLWVDHIIYKFLLVAIQETTQYLFYSYPLFKQHLIYFHVLMDAVYMTNSQEGYSSVAAYFTVMVQLISLLHLLGKYNYFREWKSYDLHDKFLMQKILKYLLSFVYITYYTI